MTTLMITPYAPYRDGIATYAVQEVRSLRANGDVVEVLSPLPSAAHRHLPMGRVVDMVKLVRIASTYDKVIIQFYPELLFGRCRGGRELAAVWRSLQLLAKRTSLVLRVHEIDYVLTTCEERIRRAATAAFEAADSVEVHTEAERQRLVDALQLDLSTVHIVDHGQNFRPQSAHSKAEAREELGLPADATVFVSIGFIQRHKGFDRGVRAFRSAEFTTGDAAYYIVGGTRVDHEELALYAEELRTLVAEVEGVEFREGFVGDEEFDRWLIASDAVVLPYREIWSSGVVERARLFGRPVVVTNVGGLAGQVPEGSHVVGNDEELADALRQLSGLGPLQSASSEDDDLSGDELQRLIVDRAGPHVVENKDNPLHQVGRLHAAPPNSARPGVAPTKKLLQRLTGWQVDPVIDYANELQNATAQIVDRLLRLEQSAGRRDESEDPSTP